MRKYANNVIYQIYLKSFKDTTGNGIGDLKGIIEKLDYLADLGVDYLWLTPFFPSPQKDNGYDISDYYNIDPLYGSMEDFDLLINIAEKLNLKIMIDLVFNHTSTEHPWFQSALKGEPQFMDYYYFKSPLNGKEPTNWESKFGGSAWKYVRALDMYYLHLFDESQADLNWRNPEVRDNLYQICNFWINKGVKGFRFDVINLVSKSIDFKDDFHGFGKRFYTDGPDIHTYLQELNKKTFGKHPEIITVGEMSSSTIEDCIKYSSQNELHMCFNFHHLKVDYQDGNKWSKDNFDFLKLKRIFNDWQSKIDGGGGWNALFWCNHDQPRIVSRLGNDKKFHKQSAKMLATAIHLMKGTPYIYQGEEIGMTNADFDCIEAYRDIETINYYKTLIQIMKQKDILEILKRRSRDNSRTPMQWNAESNAGFSLGIIPWIDVCKNYKEINVAKALLDQDSILNYYKKLIMIRKESEIVSYGKYEILEIENPYLYIYKRHYRNKEMLVICNFFEKKVENPINTNGYELILGNYIDKTTSLRPFETRVYSKS